MADATAIFITYVLCGTVPTERRHTLALTKYALEKEAYADSPLKFLYVTSSRYENDWESLKHTHYFTELFYVKEGSGAFLVEDETFPIARNDLIIVNPNTEHTEMSNEDNPLEYYILGVEGLGLSFESGKEFVCFNCKEKEASLSYYFAAMLKELDRKETDYLLVCRHLLEILLIHVSRAANLSFEIAPSQKSSRECSRVKRYIDANFKDDITLDMLADMAHLNKYYFIHAFTKYYNISPMNYLIEKRMQASQDLLLSADYSIAEVAQVTGFSSQSYFSQCFRKKCGMTPGTYRRRMRNAGREESVSQEAE